MPKQHKITQDSSTPRRSSAEDIRALAYQLYCENGCQEGHDMDHWLEAERQLSGREKAPRQKAA